MNSDPDPEAEDRKGCSGHVGKMIYSAGVSQLALVAYVPDAEHNKSASKIDVQVWMDHVLKTVGGGKVLVAKGRPHRRRVHPRRPGEGQVPAQGQRQLDGGSLRLSAQARRLPRGQGLVG